MDEPTTEAGLRAYGCVRCQTHHAERDGDIYREHLSFQSKHGIYRMTEREWAMSRPTEPRTGAGRRLVAGGRPYLLSAVLAIENEARASQPLTLDVDAGIRHSEACIAVTQSAWPYHSRCQCSCHDDSQR